MSDPVSNSEIEDVLSSIRRLVAADNKGTETEARETADSTEGQDGAPPDPMLSDALVLSPAQRVEDTEDDESAASAWEADALADAKESGESGPAPTVSESIMPQPVEGASEPRPEEQEIDTALDGSEADVGGETDDTPDALADAPLPAKDPIVPPAPWDDASLAGTAPAYKLPWETDDADAEPIDPTTPSMELPPEAEATDGAMSSPTTVENSPVPNAEAELSGLSNRIAGLEAALDDADGDWEPDGSEVAASPSAMGWDESEDQASETPFPQGLESTEAEEESDADTPAEPMVDTGAALFRVSSLRSGRDNADDGPAVEETDEDPELGAADLPPAADSVEEDPPAVGVAESEQLATNDPAVAAAPESAVTLSESSFAGAEVETAEIVSVAEPDIGNADPLTTTDDPGPQEHELSQTAEATPAPMEPVGDATAEVSIAEDSTDQDVKLAPWDTGSNEDSPAAAEGTEQVSEPELAATMPDPDHSAGNIAGDDTDQQGDAEELEPTVAADEPELADATHPALDEVELGADADSSVSDDSAAMPAGRLHLGGGAEAPILPDEGEVDPWVRDDDATPAEDDVDVGEDDNVFAEDVPYLDEDTLRDMVSDIVRQELQGALGERITRNVRKLVRREIHRALASRDFD